MAVDWSMGIIDPLRSQAQGRSYVDSIYDQAYRRKAGQAASAGDYQGAATALGERGDVEGALKVRTFGADQANADVDRKLKMFQAQTDYMKRAVPIFAHIFKTAGPQAALQAFDQITPELQQIGVPPQTIAQYRQAFAANPEATLQALGAATAKDYEFRNQGDDILVFEKGNPNPVNVIKGTPKAADAAKAPTTRTVNIGGEEVTQEYVDGAWKEVGRAPRYKPEAQGGNPNADRRFAVQLRSQFNNEADVKAFNDVANSTEIINDLARSGTAADDMALIFSFMKTLDPGSVVREGEFANAQNTAGVPDQIRNLYNRALSGNRLNPNQRKQFASTVQSVYTSRKRRYDQLVRQYQGYARDANLPEGTIQPREAIAFPSAAPAGGGSGIPFRNAPAYSGGADTDALVNKYLGQ